MDARCSGLILRPNPPILMLSGRNPGHIAGSGTGKRRESAT
jgi:hypothetical protein